MSQSGKERRCSSQANDEDRLSALSDDIILSILGRLDITTATRTSVLSKRWRNLPWLLPELNLLVCAFLPVPCPAPVEAHQMDQATTCLTKATRSFLADPSRKSTNITRLRLQLYMSSSYSREIGPLVCDVINSGVVKQLELGIADAKLAGCQHEDMDVHHLLFDSCKELMNLTLCHCDVGDYSVWQINAPDSKLTVVEVLRTRLERVEVLCLPKLQHLCLDSWLYFEPPLRFGFVPSLKELTLRDGTFDCVELSLSAVLQGTTNIHTLTLDFKGKSIWIQPEGKQLCPAFNKLRELSICGIFVNFGLLCTINLLEAAPSVEIFCVQIWDHLCEEDEQSKTKPSWSMPGFTSSKTWQLKELVLVGFSPLEQQTLFIRAVMKRAPNLKAVLLKEDERLCGYCEAMDTPSPPPRGGFFPWDTVEQEAMVKQLRDGVCSSPRIIFSSSHASVKCAVYS